MIKIQVYFLFLFCVLSQFSFAQYYGGAKNDKGVAFCQIEENFFLAGTTRSFGRGSDDMFVVKVTENWEDSYHSEWGGLRFDVAGDIIATSDGHYLLTGHSWDAPGGRSTVILAKYNTSSQLIWIAYLGDWHNDYVYSVKETRDNGYLITGINRAQGVLGAAFLAKTDQNGVLLWQQFYETPTKDIGMDVVECTDGSLLILATTSSFINKIANSSEYFSSTASNILVIKTDAFGQEIWRKPFGGVKHDFAKKIISDGADNFYIVGSSLEQTNGSFDIIVHKIDVNGNLLWRKNFGGTGYEYGNDIDINTLGELLITGTSSSFSADENPDIFVLKLDENGDEIWSTTLGASESDYGNAGAFLADESIGILGTSKSNSNNDEDLYFVQLSTSNGHILKALNTDNMIEGVAPSLFPNPTQTYIHIDTKTKNANTNIHFKLYDISGRLIQQESFQDNSKTIYFNNRLAQGIYVYKLTINEKGYQGKIIIN
jgi:hypothetical protein